VVVGTDYHADSGKPFGVPEMVLAWLVRLDEVIAGSNHLRRSNHL
jgi:hypothetical protein